ncbi:MAG: archease [Candidatus Nanoarchaeia archaeon]
MKYKFLEHTADIAFEAYGKDLNELFQNAALAVGATTIPTIEKVETKEAKEIELTADSLGQLLIDFLEELVFIKDTLHLVFSDIQCAVSKAQEHAHIRATLKGEKIDDKKHELGNDIKAVTYHDFKLEETKEGWKCYIILDI